LTATLQVHNKSKPKLRCLDLSYNFCGFVVDLLVLDILRIRCTTSCTTSKQHIEVMELESLNPVYTIQPVVNPVVQPVWQLAVSCKQTSNRLSNRFDNRFDNRLYRVYKHLTGCQPGLTTGCIV